MKLIFHATFFYFYFQRTSSFLNQDEIEISFDLIKKLGIRQCILVGDLKIANPVQDIKRFSSVNVPVTFLDYETTADYVDDTKIVYFNTGLIFKEENLDILEELSLTFEEVDRTYKLRNFVWITFIGNQTKNFEFNKLLFPYDCEFIGIQLKNESTYKLTEIYTVKNRSHLLDFGTWGTDFGLQASNVSFYRRRLNFQKSEIRVLTKKILDSWIYTQLNEILNGFEYMMNFTIHLHITKSAKNNNEELKIGDISADIQAYDYVYHNCDKLGPIIQMEIDGYIKHPRVELRADYYHLPLETSLWHVLLVFLLSGTVLILVTHNLIPNKKRCLIDDLFLGLESFCNQCGNDDIKNVSLRLICIWLRLLVLILIAAYGAIITSYFAVELFQPPFKNLEQFLANGEYRLLISNQTQSIRYLVMVNRDNILYKKLYENFTKFIEIDSFQQLLEKMCSGKYAVQSFINDMIDNNWPCTPFKIPEPFGTIRLGILLKKNSFITKILQENLVRFYETGIQMRFKTLMNDTVSDQSIPEDSFQPIKLEQMKEVLSIPFLGILLGMAIITLEIIYKRCSLLQNKIKVRQSIFWIFNFTFGFYILFKKFLIK